jgi:hypothetical protein
MQPKDIPVLIIIFNRPDKVRQLITALGAVQPKKIYVVADGPRENITSDIKTTTAAREAAIDIPWECEVHTKFLDENLRSRYKAVEYSAVFGLDWFFEENEMGIILEDDCIPDPTFFTFCADLLERYKEDKRIMHISGSVFQDNIVRGEASYYFSHFTNVWGWATWARAWNRFHPAVADMDTFLNEKRLDAFPLSKKARRFGKKSYQSQKHWDSLWQYTILHENGLSITPNQNLVTNIGFGAGSTNTLSENHPLANMSTRAISTIIHPSKIQVDAEADAYHFKKVFFVPLYKRVYLKLLKVMRGNY